MSLQSDIFYADGHLFASSVVTLTIRAGQLETARADLKEEQIMRKALRNELEDLKGKIRVYCRYVYRDDRTEAFDSSVPITSESLIEHIS